jgi:uncharacterized protein with GYD domain
MVAGQAIRSASVGDSRAAGCRLAQAFGGTLDSIYWLPLAPYNMLIITDMPDTICAAAITFAIMSKGAEVRAATYELLTREQFSDALQLAADARQIYRAPGEHD